MIQKNIKAYIIDDNVDACEVLKIMLERHFSVETVGVCNSALAAIDDLMEKTTDIIFLDIEMPDISGLEFCQLIKQQINPETKVVFYSAHSKYVINAMRQEAFDFLLKPPTMDEIGKIISRYYENKLTTIDKASRCSQLPRPLLVVNYKNEQIRIDIDNFAFFRFSTDDNSWEVICIDGKSFTLRRRTNADMILSLTRDFVQINKKNIVNVRHVDMISENRCLLNIKTDEDLLISRSFKQTFLDAFYSI